jgi:PAS domain S-box-containing protein
MVNEGTCLECAGGGRDEQIVTEAQDEAAKAAIHAFSADVRKVLNDLPTGVMLVDLEGRIVDMNAAALEIFEVQRNQVLGRHPIELFPARDLAGEPVATDDRPLAQPDLASDAPEVILGSLVFPSGDKKWLLARSKLLRSDGVVIGGINTVVDITVETKSRIINQLFRSLMSGIRSHAEEDDLLEHMCKVMVEQGGYALAWVGVAQSDAGRTVRPVASAGNTRFLFDGIMSWSGRDERGLGPTGVAIRTQLPQVANDLCSEPNYDPWRTRAAEHGFGSSLSLPFSIGSTWAVLVLYAEEPFSFDDETAQSLGEMALDFGLGVEHASLRREVSEALERTILAVVDAAEAHHRASAGQARRISELSARMAKQMGLSDQMVELVRLAALAKGVGGVGIPREILDKPSALDPEEEAEMRRHVVIGFDLLSRASMPWPIPQVALEHHERIDGSGYPHGLIGDAICLPARIAAVADCFDKATVPGSSAAAVSDAEAVAEIERRSGLHFDPEVVEALVALTRDGHERPSP